MIAVLAGGVGAARFLRGLVRVVSPDQVVVIGNTGDDIHVYGVDVSPDVDIVIYMLAGVFDEERGYGILGEGRSVMEELRAAGTDAWFDLGDRDLGVCAARTAWLARGATPGEIAARIARRFGVATTILPMTDDPVRTLVRVREPDGREPELHFQEYWVARRARDPALGVRLDGAARARPAPGVLDAIATAETVVVAPSNPVVSIGTILTVPGIRDAVRNTRARVVGISPIVGGRVVRGMADKLMPAVGADVSALGVATLYRDFLDAFVIDVQDESLAPSIEALGMRVSVAQTLMHTPEDAAALAKHALESAR